jgi:hypothetical protein
MTSASQIRTQIETVLGNRIPGALTPRPPTIRPVTSLGIASIDGALNGGLPVGAVTEMVGDESSGRTSLALSFAARMTQASKVCAWIDVADVLDPESAAATGVDLRRLLWVRCRTSNGHISSTSPGPEEMCQALKVADLLLQSGGFSLITLDMGSVLPEYVLRVPLSTWFRYRAAAERTQTSFLLLTQKSCAKSSSNLILKLRAREMNESQRSISFFTGLNTDIDVIRKHFTPPPASIPGLKKEPQSYEAVNWYRRTTWSGRR